MVRRAALSTALLPTTPLRTTPLVLPARGLSTLTSYVGRPVLDGRGRRLGRVADLVAGCLGEHHPPVTGLIVRARRRESIVALPRVASVTPRGIVLGPGGASDGFDRRDGEFLLRGDLLDRQIVDDDGRRVTRASDLWLASTGDDVRLDDLRLVGVDVSLRALVRRLLPTRRRALGGPDQAPERVVDWAFVRPLTDGVGPVRLQAGLACTGTVPV